MRRRLMRGQGMTEYVIIVAVVAVLSIAIVFMFGNQIRNWFFVSSDQMAGGDAKIENQTDGEQYKRSMSDLSGGSGSGGL